MKSKRVFRSPTYEMMEIPMFAIPKSDAKALSEILVRSASLKRKPSKQARALTCRLFATCAEILEFKCRS